jgi:hypothetical protein
VAKILGDLQTAIDSAADAVNAEAAFQLARGNPARAAGALDAISSGEVPPPDLGFAATPRTGTGLTHRVAMVLDAAGGPVPPGWADRSASPRARTDPVLDSWAGRLLGPATGISARVEELAPNGSVTATHLIALEDLGLSAIDFVWASASAGAEIVQRVLDAARHPAGTGTPPAGTSLRVDLARLPGSGPADRGLGDLVELAAQARGLLAGARPLDGADFQPPHADPQRGLDLDEYQQRVSAAEQALASARGSLQAAITNATPGGPAQPLRTAMLAAAGFGVSGAVPATPAPGSDEAAGLAAQASAALGEIDRRLADLAAAAAAAADETDGTRRDRLQQRLGMVFGQGFVALPRFTAANAADLAASRADASLHADDPLAAYTWLQLMERVRPPLARLGRPMQEAEALGSGEGLNLSIAQIPHVPGQRWAGLPQGDTAADGPGVPDGCASLVLQGAPADLAGQLCGLLVDEWTEVVPSRNETTGIAFQYDPPDACAPQAILLAVPPVIGEPWQVGTLNRVLLETLDLARLRGVDPAALGDVAHYLPAIYLAFNVNADAVSTDPNPLAP